MSKWDVADMLHHDVLLLFFDFLDKRKFCSVIAVISRATHILCAPEFSGEISRSHEVYVF